ncbi:MAG TPA: glycosyltransferase family 2 protein [Acidimicrobiales bacterium]|nr:glycosyltransferase family 2 protein [Acidimicrobiales bacterium]
MYAAKDALAAPKHEPARFKLTVVVPVFNEERTIHQVLEALDAQRLADAMEVIVVDDGSTDDTSEILDSRWQRHRVVRHDRNRGKGAAVRTGIELATGTHLLVFDADSEYDAGDIPRLVEPILNGRAEVVYGVRMRGSGTTFPYYLNAVGNRLMTGVANAIFGSAITDMHTCLKLLPLPMLRGMRLDEEGFGLDTEISAELLRLGFRPYEVAVTYVGRSPEEGKKIRLGDAGRCLAVLCKVRTRGRVRYARRDRSLAPPVSEAPRPTTVIRARTPGLDVVATGGGRYVSATSTVASARWRSGT